MSGVDDLVAFLRARLDEDSAAAKKAAPEGEAWELDNVPEDSARIEIASPHEWEVVVYDEGRPSRGQAEHILRWQPARVLREVEAKRRIVDEYNEVRRMDRPEPEPEYAVGRAVGLGEAVRLLALPYSDHPDYREEWRP